MGNMKKVLCWILILLFIGSGCAKKEKEGLKIALIMKARSNPFFASMEDGAKKAADSLAVRLTVGALTQETEINKQISLIENTIIQKVDAVLVAPADSRAIVNVLKKAQDKGIIVINLDNRIDLQTAKSAGLKIYSYIGVDNELGGKMAGDYLIKLMGGKGNTAMLEGIRGVDNAEARKRGFLKAIEEGTDVKLVASQSANWAQDKGLDVFSNILQANPDINGLFCANDMMALGAIQAIEQAKMTGKIFVTSYDNLNAAQEAIIAGKLHATIEQHPEIMGYIGIVTAVDILNGKEVPDEILIPLELITKEKLLKK